jgi:TRAP-type C4-dicarboxylate transport system permease small subunit
MEGPAPMLTIARRAAEAIGIALYAAMFVLFVAGVTARYVFGTPITWSDEMCIILLLWSLFWCAAFTLPDKDHVTFDIAWLMARPAQQRIMALVAAWGFGLLYLAALYPTYDYIAFLWRERTAALQWRQDVVYFCFTIFIAATAFALLRRGVRLSRRDWNSWL